MDLLDFKSNNIDPSLTVQTLFNESGCTRLKFYLCTRHIKVNKTSDQISLPSNSTSSTSSGDPALPIARRRNGRQQSTRALDPLLHSDDDEDLPSFSNSMRNGNTNNASRYLNEFEQVKDITFYRIDFFILPHQLVIYII